MSTKARPAAKKKTAAKPAPKSAVAKSKTPLKKPAAKAAPAKAKPSPAKKAAPAKTVTKKAPAAKKPPTASAAAKPTAKKPAAKPVPKKAAAPAKPAAAKKAPAKKAPVQKATPAKPAPVKKAAPAKAPKAPAPAKAASKPPKKTAAPAPAAPTPAKAPTPALDPASGMRKNSRAAKMAALVPPPPAPVVASNAAKSSFMPLSVTAPAAIVPIAPKKDPRLANSWKSKKPEELSDAEVIAMPDGEYMNEVQLAFFRRKLELLKQEVLSNASETTEHLREDTVVVPDPADRATIEEEHALELRTRDRERKLLKKIEQSIARIDAGDYGYCDETGEPIGVARLLARPTATLSLEAQERRELKQKMFGD